MEAKVRLVEQTLNYHLRMRDHLAEMREMVLNFFLIRSMKSEERRQLQMKNKLTWKNSLVPISSKWRLFY